MDDHDRAAFAAVSSLTVGGFRDWLLEQAARPEARRPWRLWVRD